MIKAFIGIGSNQGDRLFHFKQALKLLNDIQGVKITRVASLYETEPVGYLEQDTFLNTAAELETILPPHELLKVLLDTEAQLGRVRTIRWGPRNIDLDLLLYGFQSIRSEQLEVPHPRILERAFVLGPLLELNPTLRINKQDARQYFEYLKSVQKITCITTRLW